MKSGVGRVLSYMISCLEFFVDIFRFSVDVEIRVMLKVRYVEISGLGFRGIFIFFIVVIMF